MDSKNMFEPAPVRRRPTIDNLRQTILASEAAIGPAECAAEQAFRAWESNNLHYLSCHKEAEGARCQLEESERFLAIAEGAAAAGLGSPDWKKEIDALSEDVRAQRAGVEAANAKLAASAAEEAAASENYQEAQAAVANIQSTLASAKHLRTICEP
jgi:hypothetical protein